MCPINIPEFREGPEMLYPTLGGGVTEVQGRKVPVQGHPRMGRMEWPESEDAYLLPKVPALDFCWE